MVPGGVPDIRFKASAKEREGVLLKVGELFNPEPDHWGLRGDAFLWKELAEKLADQPVPGDVRELERLLENAFWEATGHSLSFCTEILVDRFAGDGLSRGGISGATWRYRLFPLIVQRYETATAKTATG